MASLTKKQKVKRNENIKAFKKRQEVIESISRDRADRVMVEMRGVKLKAKVKIKSGVYNGLPSGIKKQLARLSDYINDRNALRVQQTESKHYVNFKNLYVVYAMLGNQVVGWANYLRRRNKKNFKLDHDALVFFHVKKKYRGNGIGKKLFKQCYKRLVKGKKNQREMFVPKFNNDPHGYFKGQDFYSKMLRKAKGKEL